MSLEVLLTRWCAENDYMGETVNDDTKDTVAKDTWSPESDVVNLPLGSELSEQDAIAIERAVPTRLIVIAGPAGSGKTTLLTGLYRSFSMARSRWLFICWIPNATWI